MLLSNLFNRKDDNWRYSIAKFDTRATASLANYIWKFNDVHTCQRGLRYYRSKIIFFTNVHRNRAIKLCVRSVSAKSVSIEMVHFVLQKKGGIKISGSLFFAGCYYFTE